MGVQGTQYRGKEKVERQIKWHNRNSSRIKQVTEKQKHERTEETEKQRSESRETECIGQRVTILAGVCSSGFLFYAEVSCSHRQHTYTRECSFSNQLQTLLITPGAELTEIQEGSVRLVQP